MIIADSDVLIDYLGAKNPAADRVTVLLENRELCTTAVTRFEVMSGARGPKKIGTAQRLFAALITLPLDSHSAERAASIRRELEARGEGIGMADSLIAGIALSAEL